MTLRDQMIERLADAIWEHTGDEYAHPPIKLATVAFDAMTPPLGWEFYIDDTGERWSTACGSYIVRKNDPRAQAPWTSFCAGTWQDHMTREEAMQAAEDHYLRERFRGTKLMEGLE